MINNPTILVKKADGSTVRMTIDELKSLKSQPKAGPSNSAGRQPRVEKTPPKAAPPPIKLELNSDKNKPSRTWEAEDHKSLLDEEFHKETPVLVAEGEHILARSTPVRDIFVDEARYQAQAATKLAPKLVRPKNSSPLRLAGEIPLPRRPRPSVLASVIPTPKPLATRPVIHDIKPPKIEKLSVGPIDELNKFTLADFRRLGVSAEEASAKLREKFTYLENDSFLLFMDGVEAWYNSPLYQEYSMVLSASLKKGLSVAEILSARAAAGLNLNEFKAILKLNQSIN